MNELITQMRSLLDQLEQGGAPAGPAKQPMLPPSDNPRASMQLTEDGHFLDPFWMEGQIGALPGVRIQDWASATFTTRWLSGGIPLHMRVLLPDYGQMTISAADIGWMDASGYDPDNYADFDARRAAWIAVGAPTVGPRGKFDSSGGYRKPGDGHALTP